MITLASRGLQVLSCGSSGVHAVFAHFMASSVSHGAATPPLLPTLTVYLSGTLIGFLGMCGIWACVFPVAFAVIALTVPTQVLVVALRSVAEVAAFSPIPRFLARVLGFFLSCLGISRLRLNSLWCCLLALYASPPLRLSPAVAGLVGFRCDPPHWLSLRVCVGPFWGGGAVSSFSPTARRRVGYC